MDAYLPHGINFTYFELKEEEIDHAILRSDKNIVHRDDYYLFLFLETAEVTLTIDFEEVQLGENSVLYVRPGQVHFASAIRGVKGSSLAIDSTLVDKDYKKLFEAQFLTQRPVFLKPPVLPTMSETARLLNSFMQAPQTAFSNNIILNLANVFIGIIAGQYTRQHKNLLQGKSRSALIAHRFKELLSENYRTVKSPTQYAKALNYSLSHLNESVKTITGYPVSYWIHQQVILEAKRLLYYTDMEVKEIAFALGYEDHTYFSRLFSGIAGFSPGAFRRKFHE